MSTIKISAMTPSDTLTGAEQLEIVQGGNTRRTTTDEIAALAGTPEITSTVEVTDHTTATAGQRIIVRMNGICQITLPASPSNNDTVEVILAGHATSGTIYPVNILRNDLRINGVPRELRSALSTPGDTIRLRYFTGTLSSWHVVNRQNDRLPEPNGFLFQEMIDRLYTTTGSWPTLTTLQGLSTSLVINPFTGNNVVKAQTGQPSAANVTAASNGGWMYDVATGVGYHDSNAFGEVDYQCDNFYLNTPRHTPVCTDGTAFNFGDKNKAHQPSLNVRRLSSGGYFARINFYNGSTLHSAIENGNDYDLRLVTNGILRQYINLNGQCVFGNNTS